MMIATNYLIDRIEPYVKPAIEWSKQHKLLISSIALGILSGITTFYLYPTSFDWAKRSVKALTIVLPITFSIITLALFILIIDKPHFSSDIRHNDSILSLYNTINRNAWRNWWQFVVA